MILAIKLIAGGEENDERSGLFIQILPMLFVSALAFWACFEVVPACKNAKQLPRNMKQQLTRVEDKTRERPTNKTMS